MTSLFAKIIQNFSGGYIFNYLLLPAAHRETSDVRGLGCSSCDCEYLKAIADSPVVSKSCDLRLLFALHIVITIDKTIMTVCR